MVSQLSSSMGERKPTTRKEKRIYMGKAGEKGRPMIRKEIRRYKGRAGEKGRPMIRKEIRRYKGRAGVKGGLMTRKEMRRYKGVVTRSRKKLEATLRIGNSKDETDYEGKVEQDDTSDEEPEEMDDVDLKDCSIPFLPPGLIDPLERRVLYMKQEARKPGNAKVESKKRDPPTLEIGELMFPKCTNTNKIYLRKFVLPRVLKTLPFSGGRSEIILRKHVEQAIMSGSVHPSEIRYDLKWWKMCLKELKAERKYPLGRNHPLTRKFAAVARRYAKERRCTLMSECGGPCSRGWPYKKITCRESMHGKKADEIVEHIRMKTKQFGKIKHLFEGNTGKMGSLCGWPVMDLMILLEQLQSDFDHKKYTNRMVIKELNRFWAVKSKKVKRKNRRIKMMGKKGMEYRPEKLKEIWRALQGRLGRPSLQQSLDCAKVYLAQQFSKSQLQNLASEDLLPQEIERASHLLEKDIAELTEEDLLPQEIERASHLLEKDIAELTEEAPVVPGYYYYATVFPYYKWLYDVRASEARKEFYLKVANFFLRNKENYEVNPETINETPLDNYLVSYIK